MLSGSVSYDNTGGKVLREYAVASDFQLSVKKPSTALMSAKKPSTAGKLTMQILGLLFTLTAALACSHLPHVEQPYLLIHFPGIDFFIEGEASVDSVRPVGSGDFRLVQEEGFATYRYRAVGDGAFIVRDYECHVLPKTISCNGRKIDRSLGGVILKRNGELLAVNPLIVSAK
jgi:hypothetical protein